MSDEAFEPYPPLDQSTTLVEQDSPALASFLDDSLSETHRLRHDGWNGQKMARLQHLPPLGETAGDKTRDTVNFINFRAQDRAAHGPSTEALGRNPIA